MCGRFPSKLVPLPGPTYGFLDSLKYEPTGRCGFRSPRVEFRIAIVAAWLALTSLVAFGACVWDKQRAQGGGSRVRERTLLVWALVGGSPGLLVGMVLVRHKVRKASF